MTIKNKISGLARLRNGAALVEYVTLVGLIGALAIGSVVGLGQRLDRNYTDVAEALASATPRGDLTSPEESLPETAPPAGGGGVDIPEEAATACVDLGPATLSDISSGATTLEDEGIGDCVNIGWDTGFMSMDDPQIGFVAEPLFINLGPTSLPSDGSGTVFMPENESVLSVSDPIADSWYNVWPSGPVHLTIVGFQPADLDIQASSGSYSVTFPNNAVLSINGLPETVKIGDGPREVFEIEPTDFSQPFNGPSLTISGYNPFTQGPTPPEGWETSVIWDGDAGNAFMEFEELNNYNLTYTWEPILNSTGAWRSFGPTGDGNFFTGYWQEEESCDGPPDDTIITLNIIGEDDRVMVIESFVYFQPVPC